MLADALPLRGISLVYHTNMESFGIGGWTLSYRRIYRSRLFHRAFSIQYVHSKTSSTDSVAGFSWNDSDFFGLHRFKEGSRKLYTTLLWLSRGEQKNPDSKPNRGTSTSSVRMLYLATQLTSN